MAVGPTVDGKDPAPGSFSRYVQDFIHPGFLPPTVVRLRSRGAKSDLTFRDMNKKVCVLDILLPRNGVALAGWLSKKPCPTSR